MKKNVGGMDKTIRMVVGVALLVLGLWQLPTTLGIVLSVLGVISLLTGYFGFCGLYTLLGISTCPMKKTASDSKQNK